MTIGVSSQIDVFLRCSIIVNDGIGEESLLSLGLSASVFPRVMYLGNSFDGKLPGILADTLLSDLSG